MVYCIFLPATLRVYKTHLPFRYGYTYVEVLCMQSSELPEMDGFFHFLQ